VAKRLAAELGDEQPCFREGNPDDWDLVPRPDGACKVGMDGASGRHCCAQTHNVAVLVGQSPPAFGETAADKSPSSKRLGVVQRLDTKAKRRW